MAIVVSDTSAIAALIHLDLAEVLRSLFVEVYIPTVVAWELKNPRGPRPAVDVSRFSFITIRLPSDRNRVTQLQTELDPGESEAIALALELSADWILIDESAGRRTAIGLGLRAMGVCGILIFAKRRGLVPAVGPLIQRLIDEIDFRISSVLLAEVIHRAGESPGS